MGALEPRSEAWRHAPLSWVQVGCRAQRPQLDQSSACQPPLESVQAGPRGWQHNYIFSGGGGAGDLDSPSCLPSSQVPPLGVSAPVRPSGPFWGVPSLNLDAQQVWGGCPRAAAVQCLRCLPAGGHTKQEAGLRVPLGLWGWGMPARARARVRMLDPVPAPGCWASAAALSRVPSADPGPSGPAGGSSLGRCRRVCGA